jgi:RNA polymerase sigma-70 factor (ECF subfamily)
VDAEDIVQEVFLRVLRSWHRFHKASGERTWVWGITRNCLREHYRRQARTRAHFAADDVDAVPDPLEPAPEDRVLVAEALRRLNPSQRAVFVLNVLQQKSGRECAQILGWSEVKVRVTVHRSIKLLREVLKS